MIPQATVSVFSAQDWLLILGAIGTVVTIIGSVAVNIINAKLSAVSSKIDANTKITADTAQVTADVHAESQKITEHVNGSATRMVAKIDSLENELKILRETLAEKKETAAVLAARVSEIEGLSARKEQP